MLPIVPNAAVCNASARRLVATAVLATFLGFIAVATATRAETPSPATTPPPIPPQATESKTTTQTTPIARAPAPSEELNTLLMHDTFLIAGPGKVPGQTSFGTVFAMGIPSAGDPKIAQIVLVTAAHVFENIIGDNATLLVRRKNADGTYVAFGYQLPLRKGGKPLYVRHATADVAAMYGDIPDEVPMTSLPPNFLVTDKTLEDLEIHPGDEAFILGFPAMVATEGGFPILRTGHIASYPLTPMAITKEWAFDAHVFDGNSGGPVYFTYVNRIFKGSLHFGVAQGILGLVSKEGHPRLPEYANRDLQYGVVVPAKFIKETIDMLPPPPPELDKQPPDVTGAVK